MHVEKNISLKPLTTFHIGGVAEFFVSVKTEEELLEALSYARKNKLKTFILGDGSNIIFSDNGFSGLVIKINIKGFAYYRTNKNSVLVEASAGECWDDLVLFSIRHGLHGIENLSGIPGTIGASPVQNIGAYGVELKDVLEWVDVINMKTMKKKRLSNDDCKFEYRDSIFKKEKGSHFVVTKVCLKLHKEGRGNILYPDLKKFFKENMHPTSLEVRNAVISIRSKKFPNPSKVGTAGSFFKNPIITNTVYRELREQFPNLPSYFIDCGHVKIPLAYILDKIGLKGVMLGRIGVYKKQPLVLINAGNAQCIDVKNVSEEIKNIVKEKTGIQIENEVLFIK